MAGDSVEKESCKAGSCTKPGLEEKCVQGDGCLDRKQTSPILEAASGGAAAESSLLAPRAVLQV